MRPHSLVLGGEQAERHEHGRSRRHRTELPRPSDQEVEHRRHQGHRGGEGRPDPEPFHPLPVAADGPDVATAHRCDRQHPDDGPADRAVGQAQRPLVHHEHEPDRDGSEVASACHDTPDQVVQPAIGEGEEEVERDRRHHEGGQRADVARTAGRVRRLRLAARSQRHGRNQGIDRRQKVERGGLALPAL